jgi:histo-blood group ABO system transferase
MRHILFLLQFFFCLLTFSNESSFDLPKKKVALCITATGKYNTFANALILSGRKFFLKNHKVTYFVFGDQDIISGEDIKKIHLTRMGWPYDTLMRFEVYLNHKNELNDFDYIFAIDADMLFVSCIGDEILSDLVGTIHPGFYASIGTYERRRKSTAYVSKKEGKTYFAGGFYGGQKDKFFHLLETTTSNIQKDLSKNFIAIWHDESHLNRYFIDYPPSVKLSPSYCYPESWSIPFEKKVIALDKNHSEIRS